MIHRRASHGFTIVELLIVIVVIAILAAISIVAYNGIQERANSSAVQSDLRNLAAKIQEAKIYSTDDQYPSANSAGLGSFARATKDSYSTTTAALGYCSNSTDFFVAGRTKENKMFVTGSSFGPVKEATFTWNGNIVQMCTNAGMSGTINNSTSIWLKPAGAWQTWVQG